MYPLTLIGKYVLSASCYTNMVGGGELMIPEGPYCFEDAWWPYGKSVGVGIERSELEPTRPLLFLCKGNSAMATAPVPVYDDYILMRYQAPPMLRFD